jgi:diguanylate cyclase (GGDEF)-like protein
VATRNDTIADKHPADRFLVLVVDDDGTARLLARASLEHAGLAVEEAANGREGVAAFERLRPDLVLLDVLMPEMDGFAACAAIRALPGGEVVPVLMMTGLDDVESIREAYLAGATDFTTKPIHGTILGHRATYLIRAGKAFADLHRAEAENRALLQAIPDLVLRVSRNGVILEVHSSRGAAATGLKGKTLREVIPAETARSAISAVERAIATRGIHAIEFALPYRRGNRHLEARVVPSGDSEVIAFLRDITRRKRREERLAYLAFHDPLTGLPNRTRFLERLKEELARMQRYGDKPAVAILKLDNFKEIAEEFGQASGERLLRAIARRLSMGLRETDLVSRIGYVEFALLLGGEVGAYTASATVRRLLDLLADGIGEDDRTVVVTACAGVTLCLPEHKDDVSALLKQADNALARARSLGRDSVQMFSREMGENISRRIEMEAGLRNAVRLGQFVVHFQPVVDIRTGRIVGAEALVRWLHPKQGLIPPLQFIPLAEETGVIIDISEQVIEAACRQAGAWQEEGFAPFRVAVNISGRMFQSGDFPALTSRLLRETGLDPASLELEITESTFMKDFEKTLGVLESLRAIGVRVSIDDFGTGYSSLSRLKRFPIHQLKVDRSFTKDMTVNPDDRAIVEAIVGMARTLRIEVLAEGVEHAGQLECLRALKCDKAQGFHFGKPIPAGEFRELLLRQKRAPATAPAG